MPLACSPKHLKGCSAWHWNLVEEYRAARRYEVDLREQYCSDYKTELTEYGPIITFKSFLIGKAAHTSL